MKYYRKQPVEAIQWDGDDQMEVSKFVQKVSSVFLTKKDKDGTLIVGYLDSKQNNKYAYVPMFGWVVIEGKTLQFYKDETFKKTFKEANDDDSIWSSTQEMVDMIEKSFEDMAHSKMIGDNFASPVIPVRKDIVDAIKEAVLRSSNKTPETNTDDVIGRMILKECSPFISETLGKVRDSVEKAFNDKIREEKYKSAWGDSEGNIHFNESTPEQMKLKAMCKEFMDNYKKMLDAWIEGGIEADANELQKYAVNEKDVESDTFDSVLDEMKELHAKKDKDYGSAFHKSFMEFGPTAGIVRLNDKMERAKSLVKNGKAEVKDESLLDSLKDMACYAVMLYVELKNKGNEQD